MGNQRSIRFIWLCRLLSFSSLIQCFSSNLDELFNTILHDHAFKVMIHQRPHTGALYNASLPANLAGIKVSVVGLRSTTLWRKGANFSNFIIPPRTLPVPYVKRLAIVYHNLGNCSSLYYNLSGYSLKSPVVGFLVYNASLLDSNNVSKLELNTMGNPIYIQFKSSILAEQRNQRRKCATFGATGEVYISEMSAPDVCYSRNQGHFSIVVPLNKQPMWPFWVIGFLAGSIGLILVVFAGTMAIRSFVGKRTREMEREADEGEGLQTYWIASSKLPRAEVTRTQPILESTTLPNPKLSWYA